MPSLNDIRSTFLDFFVRNGHTAVASSPLVLGLGKRAFYELHDLPEDEAYRRAVEVMTDNALRLDAREGIAAFLEKRPPVWMRQ